MKKRELKRLGMQGLAEYAIDKYGLMWYRFLNQPDAPNFWNLVAT